MIKIISPLLHPCGSIVAALEWCRQWNVSGGSVLLYVDQPSLNGYDHCLPLNEFELESNDVIILLDWSIPVWKDLKDLQRVCEKWRNGGWKSFVSYNIRRWNSGALPKGIRIVSYNRKSPSYLRPLPSWISMAVQGGGRVESGSPGSKSRVLPDVLPPLMRKNKGNGTAGVLGSVDISEKTHEALTSALEDGWEKVIVYGDIKNPSYFHEQVLPLVENNRGRVSFASFNWDRQSMYDSLSCVYVGVARSWSPIRRECFLTGTDFKSVSEKIGDLEMPANTEILEAWREVLEPEQVGEEND
jgi:hypothetical protein